MAVALVVLWAAAARFRLETWLGYDSHAYWVAGHLANPYREVPGSRDAFLYSPVFAQAMRLLAWVPWPAFYASFATLNASVFLWLTAPLSWQWRAPILLVCATEVLTGNIAALLALSLVVGVNKGEVLGFPALTKILPGGVGLLWHVTRREWRQVARAVLATAAVTGISFVVAPNLWNQWIRFLLGHGDAGPHAMVLRALAAFALAVYAGCADRPVILALALWFALPMAEVGQIQPYTVLVAAVRLRGTEASKSEPNVVST